MALTFLDLQTEFYARGFSFLNDSTGNGTGAARAKRWINQGMRDLCLEDDWPFLLTTVTGTAPLSITDAREILFVGSPTIELQESDREEISPVDPLLTQSGTAYTYWRDGSSLKVYPADTSTWTVRYLKTPVDMVADTDQPVVPDEWRLLIVEYAVIWALRDRSNYQEAAALAQALAGEVDRMREALLDLPDRQLLT